MGRTFGHIRFNQGAHWDHRESGEIAHRNFKVSYLERVSYLEGRYNKPLVETQIASWNILRMPADSRNTTAERYDLTTEVDIRAQQGRSKPSD